ncbi:MAG: hypothetical protein ACP5RP_01135 [Candidatus Micrarchaeia archaeon]
MDETIEEIIKLQSQDFRIFRASSKLVLNDIFSIIDRINNETEHKSKAEVLQVFNPNSIINRFHITSSYMNAVFAEKEHRLGIRSMSFGIIIFAALERQLSAAIEKVGAKDPGKLLVFSNIQDLKYDCLFYKIEDFNPDLKHMIKAAKRMHIQAGREDEINLELAGRMQALKL